VLGDARGVLARTQQDLRTLSYLMHPPMLDDLGLVVAVRALIAGLASRMRMRVEFVCATPGLRTSAEVENALYRVVQESLINAHKHAAATCAEVRYFREAGRLVLEVEDNGIGMDCSDEQTMGAGVGIQGMRARVEQLGGALIVSGGAGGVLIRAEFPVLETNWGYEPIEQFLLPITPWKEGLP
jgi:signal transduction histidine kinase